MFVGLDATEEADALRGMHEGVAVSEFTEVECAADGGADCGTAARQDGERAFASAEELAFSEQEQAILEESGQLAGRDDYAPAETSVDDPRSEAADLGAGDVGVESVDGAVGVACEQAGSAVLRQGGGGAEQGRTHVGAFARRADEQGFGGRGFERVREVAERSVIGLFEDEFINLSGVKLGAKHVFVAAVDRDNQRVGR